MEFRSVFVVVNPPFHLLGWRRFGAGFTLKTCIAVASLSVLVQRLPGQITFAHLDPEVEAVLSGLALLALFRHGASLGGLGCRRVADRGPHRLRAGWVQPIVDGVMFALAFAMLPPGRVALSAVGAGVLNLMMIVDHRCHRYIA